LIGTPISVSTPPSGERHEVMLSNNALREGEARVVRVGAGALRTPRPRNPDPKLSRAK